MFGILKSIKYLNPLSPLGTLCYWPEPPSEIILCMHPANERQRYIVTLFLIDWPHTEYDPCTILISMGECKRDVTPLLMHWSYVFLALTHRYAAHRMGRSLLFWCQGYFNSLAPGRFDCNFENAILTVLFHRFVSSDVVIIMPWDECHRTLLMKINIGSGNHLVPSDNKPFPGPMLTQISFAIGCHYSLGHNDLIHRWMSPNTWDDD